MGSGLLVGRTDGLDIGSPVRLKVRLHCRSQNLRSRYSNRVSLPVGFVERHFSWTLILVDSVVDVLVVVVLYSIVVDSYKVDEV